MNNGTLAHRALFDGVRNIIFDLGGVLYNIDYHLVEQELSALQHSGAATLPRVLYTRETQPAVFMRYEVGSISTHEFYTAIRQELGIEATDMEIARAWNAMLLGMYPGRNALIWRVKQRYRLALLSNTNELHIEHIKPECTELFSLFEKLFFSYEMGMRKPEKAIFFKVLHDMGYIPEETLFIDDSYQHIQAARECGLRTLWLQHPDSLDLAVDMLVPRVESVL
ncbi:MAG: HAD family phosphatase [Bacteroidota bacterium]|nr:HAD family phosphatase [Candidatus Kapabacteria bacterium]MDW8220957.1 HAD family phosphatase [Bacteroidota bacterium]